MTNWQKELREWVILIVITLLIMVPINIFALDNRTVPTGSMIPTIKPGDRLFVDTLSYRFRDLERGDIVVFSPPAGLDITDDLIKRLIGLPGDTIEIKNGQLFLNDIAQDEPYINEPITYTMPKILVPEGKIFVLGDNRNSSYDSHMWGFVDMNNVKGKALWRYWPFSRLTLW